MYKMLYLLIFSTLLFSCSDSENLDSTNSTKQDPKAEVEVDILRLAAVKIGDKWGYINHKVEIVIKPQFDDTKMFSDGLAAIKISDKWGYINPGGEVVIKPQFSYAGIFSRPDGKVPAREGFAFVRTGVFEGGFINREGKFFDNVGDFSEGLARVKIGRKWGYINLEGKIVIEPQFDRAEDFWKGKGGLARVRIDNKRGFIYPVGMAPIPVNYKQGFINREGKFFDNVGTFSEGLRCVKIGDKWGYINQVGKIVIEPQFDRAEDFSEGLAAIKISDKWGYINHKGEIVIKPQFDDARSFQNKSYSPPLIPKNDFFRRY